MKILASFSFLFLSLFCEAQKKPVIFIPTDDDPSVFKYRYVIEQQKTASGSYPVKTYYDSGKVESEGHSSKPDILIKDGAFTHYYESGAVQSRFSYINGRPMGRKEEWYEDGQIKSSGTFYETDSPMKSVFKLWNYWDANHNQTIINGNGHGEHSEGKSRGYGEIKNGLKEGKWEGVSQIPQLTYTEYYSQGKLSHGQSKDSAGNIYKYTEAHKSPEPPRGLRSFRQFIADNYRVPPDYYSYKKETIYATFAVNTDGEMEDIKIVVGVSEETDKEMIRTLSSYRKKWTPGTSRGVAVRSLLSLPLRIQVQ